MLTAVGAGATIALAGCSGNGQDGSGNEENEPDATQTDSESSPEDTESETTEAQDTETSTETSSEDTVYNGEEELEDFLSNGEILSDYHWIEFESPQTQFDSPIESGLGQDDEFNYFVENGSFRMSQTGQDYEIDGMYVAKAQDQNGEDPLAIFMFNAELWDEEAGMTENFRDNVYGRTHIGSTEDLETLLSEDVQAYNDTSEDFPQEYLDLIDR